MPKHGEGTKLHEQKGGHSATSGAGETLVFRQENQDPTAVVPSYYSDSARRALESKWLVPKKDKEVLRGWDSFAEYAVDMTGLLPKPNTPTIPDNNIEALDEDNLNAHGMTADQWEKEVLSILDANEDRHLIPDFQRHIQEYRRAVKATVQVWREHGLL